MKKFLKTAVSYVYIALGCLLTALGLNAFLIPNKIAAGGVTGVATVLYVKLGLSVSLTTLIMNILLFLIAYKTLTKGAIVKTLFATFALSFFLKITESFAINSGDMLLSSIYGGIILGLGIGICVANDASTGGSDFAAVMINKVLPFISVGKIILFIDTAIIVVSAYLFNDYNLILYCFFALAISVKATDYVVDGVDFAKSALIISDKYKEISEKILFDFERGVTGICCKGMYTQDEKTALLCILKSREIAKLKEITKEIDKDAFIIITDVRQTLGEGFREYN